MRYPRRHRQSYRLHGWDYANEGLYFLTICCHERIPFLGKIRNGIVGLSVPGCIAWYYWRCIPDHFSNVELDAFVVMPNHVHGIIGLKPVGTCQSISLQSNQRNFGKPQSKSISMIVNHYKGAITRWRRRNEYDDFRWQSRFYDHVIRNEISLNRIRDYIYENPLKWDENREYR